MSNEITHGAAVRGTQAEAVKTAIDAGDDYGKIVILTAGGAVLGTALLPKPCASRSGAVLTFLGVPIAGIASGTGVAAVGRITDSDDNVIIAGSADTADAAFIVQNTSFVTGQGFTVSAGSYTAPL